MWDRKKYIAWTAHAQSWEFIENRYMSDFGGSHVRLLELVRHIKNSEYLSSRLFGSTSMYKLVISNRDPLDYQRDSLHITFNLNTRKWNFEYKSMPFATPEFNREYEENQGIEKFDNFIKMIRW